MLQASRHQLHQDSHFPAQKEKMQHSKAVHRRRWSRAKTNKDIPVEAQY
jgi:hypothetical protein